MNTKCKCFWDLACCNREFFFSLFFICNYSDVIELKVSFEHSFFPQLLMHPFLHPTLSPVMFKPKFSGRVLVDVCCTFTGPKHNSVVLVADASHIHPEVWRALCVPLDLMEPSCHCCPSMNVPFVAQIDNCQRRKAWAHCVLSAIKAATPTSSAEREGLGKSGREMGGIPMWPLPKRIFFPRMNQKFQFCIYNAFETSWKPLPDL